MSGRAYVLLFLAVAAGAAPVKRERTLITDAELAAWRADPGMLRLAMNGDSCGFSGHQGWRPAKTWVDKTDEWLWKLMLPTTILRTYCVGNDHFSPDKLGCPVHGREIYKINPFYPWIIDCDGLPGKIKCPIGGETYPSNDYQAGDMTTGPYADDGSGCVIDGKRYHFIGLYAHYAYCTGVIPGIRALSRAYTLTGDPRYAHKAGVLMLKEATEYPNRTDRKNRTYIPGYGDYAGMVTDVVWAAGALLGDAYAYEEIFAALRVDQELIRFAREKVPDIATGDELLEYLEEHLLRPGLQALLDHKIQPNVGWGQQATAAVALMLNDYSDRHPNTADAMEWLYYDAGGKLRYLGNQFYKDGSSYESTGYNDARAAFLDVGPTVARIKQAAPRPYDEARYPDIMANEKLRRFRDYQAAITAVGRRRFDVGDAGSVYAMPEHKPPRGQPVRATETLDGYGLAIVRDRPDEFNVSLFYGGLRGHAHYDPLMIGLQALGRDLLPNIGYPQSWSFASSWEWSPGTHQTVVVDRDEKPCSTTVGSLEVFNPAGEVQVIEASKRPYRKDQPRGEAGPDVTDYRRQIALIGHGDGPVYALDIFRVTGGADHLQLWRGPYCDQPVEVAGAKLTEQGQGTLAGPEVALGQRYRDAAGKERWDPYCWYRDVARGPIESVATGTWSPATSDPAHLRLHWVAADATELIRANAGAPIAPDIHVMQVAFAHRAGTAPLVSQFVTVLEPYAAEPVVLSVKRLPVTGAPCRGYAPLALEVTLAGGRDILLATGGPEGEAVGDGFRLRGRFGVIRERAGRVSLHLTDGTRLRFGERTIELPEAAKARITAVRRGERTVLVDGPLPPLETLAGRRLVIDNHGERRCSYTITAAAPEGPQARLTLDSNGELGEGVASGFEDGWIKNAENINMPFAGLVKLPDGRLDTSDCFHYGAHLENGRPGVSYRVRGVEGYAYQAWALLHNAGINHVHLVDKVPKAELARAFADRPEFTIYEYGPGDEVWCDRSAEARFGPDGVVNITATDPLTLTVPKPAVPGDGPWMRTASGEVRRLTGASGAALKVQVPATGSGAAAVVPARPADLDLTDQEPPAVTAVLIDGGEAAPAADGRYRLPPAAKTVMVDCADALNHLAADKVVVKVSAERTVELRPGAPGVRFSGGPDPKRGRLELTLAPLLTSAIMADRADVGRVTTIVVTLDDTAADELATTVRLVAVTLPAVPANAVYLSDLKPARSFAHAGLKADTAYLGGELRLAGVPYAKGVMICPEPAGDKAYGEAVYELGEGAGRRLKAVVGVDDATAGRGSVTFAVQVERDGQWVELWQSPVLRGGAAPVAVDVDLGGARKLRLLTTDAGDNIDSDHAVWALARFE